MKSRPGFIAAPDQSGGSTPKALALYGIKEDAWSNDDAGLVPIVEPEVDIHCPSSSR